MAGIPHRSGSDVHPLRRDVKVLLAALACIVLIFWFFSVQQHRADARMQEASRTVSAVGSATLAHSKVLESDSTRTLSRSAVPAISSAPGTHTNKQNAGTTIDWRAPSGGAQPDLSNYKKLSIAVDLSAQRVYVQSNGKTIYTMIASTGLNDSTPHGDFTINGRGDHFYNPSDGWGADYWVSFSNNVFLFHTVPTKQDAGSYVVSEAVKLGHPASHGCVRLTLSDAKWFYEQVPDGTPVHIG